MTHKPFTQDYVPMLPWLGVVCIGVYFGPRMRHLSNRWQSLMSQSDLCGPLGWAGRHSLLIYLAHQPVLFGALEKQFAVFAHDDASKFLEVHAVEYILAGMIVFLASPVQGPRIGIKASVNISDDNILAFCTFIIPPYCNTGNTVIGSSVRPSVIILFVRTISLKLLGIH